MMMLEAEHHIRIHRDEAAIAVIGEAAVAGESSQRFHRLVVEAEVEHGIHHARHRRARAGTDRHQQRILGVAERLAGQFADIVERLLDLRLQFLRIGLAVLVEIRADRGREGEAGRHRQTEIGHFREIGALAAQEIAQARLAFGLAVAERIDPFSRLDRRRRRLGHRRFHSSFGRRFGGRLGRGLDRGFGRRLGRALRQRLAGGGLWRRLAGRCRWL